VAEAVRRVDEKSSYLKSRQMVLEIRSVDLLYCLGMENPFNYLQFATGDRFCDREEIRRDLKSRFLSGQTNVVLYGPRRYGKSSLVAELTADLEKAGISCVTLDVMKVPSIELFAAVYVQKVYRKLAPVTFELRKLGLFLKRLRPKLTLDAKGETGITFDMAGDEIGPEELTEILDLPQKLLPKGKRAVIVLDEFQEVGDMMPDDRFERVMRSVIQSHSQVSYIFLGSRHHLLRRMFTDHNRPFYKSALTILLDKPPVEESIRFVVSRFQSGGQKIEMDAAAFLVSKAENIPYFIQQIGFEVFRSVGETSRRSVREEDVVAAYRRLAGLNRDQYEQLMLTFSMAQKKLLVALARESTCEFDDAYRKRFLLGPSSTVNSAKRKLMEDGHIEQFVSECRIADPFFAEFLRSV